MMHKRRRWCVSVVASPEELASMLTGPTWTLCSGFSVQCHDDYLFLNDATHEDGAGEWGIIKRFHNPDRLVQVESITFSWCTADSALCHIKSALAGEYDESSFATPQTLQLDTPAQHGHCHLCA